MSKINTTISCVNIFVNDTNAQYKQITELSYTLLNAMNQMTVFVEDEKQKLEKQAIQLLQLEDDLKIKILNQTERIKLSEEECEHCLNEYQNANDSDHNSYWLNELNVSKKQHNELIESHNGSLLIQKDIAQKKEQFQILLRALTQMTDALQKNALDVKKMVCALVDETNYNSKALSATLHQLESYASALPFCDYEISDNYNNSVYTYASLSKTANIERKKKTYKLKRNVFGFDPQGKRYKFHRYFSNEQPVKKMLYVLMKGLRYDLRNAIMKQLEFVEFQSTNTMFIPNSNKEKRLQIIGLDINDPSFNRILLLTVGNVLYKMSKREETLEFKNHLNYDMLNKTKLTDCKIKKATNNFNPINIVKQYSDNSKITFNNIDSLFFSAYFKAYVSQDYNFLNVIKEHFGDSYQAFLKIIDSFPNQ